MSPLHLALQIALALPAFAGPGGGPAPAGPDAPKAGPITPKAGPITPKPAPPKPADGPQLTPVDARSAPKPDKAAPAVDPELSRVLDGVQRFYADARDLRARFTQTYTYKVYGRKQVSTGRVFFKKPRMMRWDYKTPAAKVFVADGRTLWVYEPEENQAFRRDLSSSQLPVALTFMSGEGNLVDEFDARLLPGPSEVYQVELIPKRHAGDYRSLVLKVDRETFAVRASTVVDPVGNINQVVFSDVATNVNLPDSGFRFTPPKGVRVISEPGR